MEKMGEVGGGFVRVEYGWGMFVCVHGEEEEGG